MATVQPLTFGALLKRSRRAAGLTQEALAERSGYSVSYVSQLERDERLPVAATVELLAEALALGAAERATLLATVRSHAPASALSLARPTTSSIPTPRLVGRSHELETIARHLEG